MTPQQKKIRKLLREKQGILLAHYYVRPEIQEIADVLGDSLALARAAAASDAKVIVFAGVHFMAQSAAILSPEKTVLLPRLDAGCPLADAATVESVRLMREKEPEALFVTYINSSAEVKALSDVCCTSSNALQIVNNQPAGKKIVMLPDGNLARHTSSVTGREVIAWEGCCPVHQALTPQEVIALKQEFPEAPFAAHPECRPDVLALADFVGSTSAILKFARESGARTIIIGTEAGILDKLRKDSPDKQFVLASEALLCADMKKITLDDIEKSLITMQPAVTVSRKISRAAKKTLDRMLSLSS
ncbi:MAG TPA: quinolinate synthase NadA [Smithellaceae bacterium]|jgi:quinolinate synthase|nr:quinolinate synthase NadA [Smithellaceae bacterium]HPV48183.1 quinolinate synthase NadA [Smithellaceae bacterium]